MDAILFRERQRFHMRLGAIALGVPPAALVVLMLRQLIWHHPWGNPPMTDGGIIFLTALACLVYLRLLTVRLVTEARADRLTIRLKGLFWRKRILVANIRSAAAVEYNAFADYGGYGFRSGPLGKAYIASGSRGVHLKLRDGREFLIGSARPEELIRGLNLPAD